MSARLEERFDISEDRALRLTTQVRYLRARGAFGERGGEEYRRHVRLLIDDLGTTLADRSGETVEKRWNDLVDYLGCQSRTDYGVYLVPWEHHDADDVQEPGVTHLRPGRDDG